MASRNLSIVVICFVERSESDSDSSLHDGANLLDLIAF